MTSRALAKWLDARGLVQYRPQTADGDCFLERLPDVPDRAVMLLSTGGNPLPAATTWGYDEPTLQLMARGAVDDPSGPQERAAALYAELQGLRNVRLDDGGPDEAWLIVCESLQTAPLNLGADDKGRYRYVLNLALHVRALTMYRD